jgi:dolichol kinase
MRTLEREITRKSIHFLGILYIPLYLYFGKDITLLVVGFLTMLSFLIEVLRLKFGIDIVPAFVLSPYEIRGWGAHLYFGVASVLLTTLLSFESAIVGVTVGCVGDGFAGIFKSLRTTGLLNAENLGEYLPSLAMFVSSFIVLYFVSMLAVSLDLRVLMISCIAGTIIERKAIKYRDYYLNDNLTVPLVSGLFYQLLS